MSHRTHRFDAWHLLAEPTFGAILATAEGEALAELARREETARDEPRADADDDAATEGRSADGDDDDDEGASRAVDDDASADDEGDDDEEYEDELGLSSDGD